MVVPILFLIIVLIIIAIQYNVVGYTFTYKDRIIVVKYSQESDCYFAVISFTDDVIQGKTFDECIANTTQYINSL